MDIADHAAEREAAFQAASLEEQRRAAALDEPGAALCAECREPIPLERRRALPSAVRCVGCQEDAERVARVPA